MSAWLASLGWQPALILVVTLFLIFVAAVLAIDAKRQRRATLLRRLNSPHFRCITDPHYHTYR